jgi:tetratricopeptide (TPR) repeat protein
VVEIRPSAGSEQSGKSGGGSEPVAPDSPDARTSAEVLIRTARDAFVRGDYGRASDAYEKALARGASRGSTNQRLAQCYERLGRKGDAIAAYERAVAAYQSQLAGGGDNSRIQAALDSSRQALKNLRG